jgi:hypothetical protein
MAVVAARHLFGARWCQLAVAGMCDTFGSLRADSLCIEATFLPDHAGEELDWKSVLRRRLF